MAGVGAPGGKVGIGRQEPLASGRTDVSRRFAMTGAAIALAGGALAGCSTGREAATVPVAAPRSDTELSDMIDGTPELAVAGERLNARLLRDFYARHGFNPVWTTRREQAESLVEAVLRAGDQGLDPELFHASLLWRKETFPPLHRDLLLSDAFLSYADALAHGAVPLERRKDIEALAPEIVDVAAVLDAATASRDPVAVVEALAPTTPTYLALREALLRSRRGVAAGGSAATARLRTIEVNLERQRWLPRALPTDRVWVNVADQGLVLYRADRPVFSARVVVGEDGERKQSPEFRALIEASFFNPPWVIPRDIVAAEILPIISRDPDYLTRNDMVMRANGEIEQQPGPNAGLGLVMFDMRNRFDVYLHDTPDRHVFSRDNRRISHGCIRVQNPLELAALLMQQPIEAVHERIAVGTTTRNSLPTPVPVFVIYQTAFVDTNGAVAFRPDFYKRDADLWRELQKRPQERNRTLQADRRPTSLWPV